MYHIPICNYNYRHPDGFQINRPEGSGDYLLLYFKQPMKIIQKGQEIITKEHAFILYNIGSEQNYQAVKGFYNSFVHFSSDDALALEKYKIPFDTVFYLPNVDGISELFRQIGYEYSLKHYLYEEKMDALLTQLLIEMARQLLISEENTDAACDLVIQFYRARFLILTQSERDWNIESMAALTNFSTSQFYHHYKTLFSVSPKAELIEARIEKAKMLLKTGEAGIGEIANMCGFKTPAHFTRYFKAKCGCAPSEYATKQIII